MASKIEELLKDKHDEKIDYDLIIKKHPWIVEKNKYCVLSPDSDGLLCGLFMSKYLGWKIIGFYDGKVAVINKKFLDKNPIFLDMEIFRKEVRSMGHHMLAVNKKHLPESWDNFENCIQPNNLRNYDGKNNFRLKYPLATIHMLVGIVSTKLKNIEVPESSIPPLFFTDGVFNVLFSYPENVLNWLSYLRINEGWHPLKKVFENDKYTVFNLMKEMNEFFRERDSISISKQRGDRLKISQKDGEPINIERIEGNDTCNISEDAKERIEKFLNLIGNSTSWNYNSLDWDCWKGMQFYKFTKRDFKADNKTITISNFKEFIDKNPLSWAMTSGMNIEYTLEEPDKMLE